MLTVARPLLSPLEDDDAAVAKGGGESAAVPLLLLHASDGEPPPAARLACLGSWRLVTVVVLFIANIALYIARSNISVAVIYIFPVCAGANGTATVTTAAVGHPSCYTESEASSLQGDTLGAFYWGYFASQVQTPSSSPCFVFLGVSFPHTLHAAVFLLVPIFGARLIVEWGAQNHSSTRTLQWLFFSTRTHAHAQVPAGFLSGRFGGKRVLTVAVALWIAATFGTTFWGANFWALYVSRIVIGLCEGSNYPCQVAILAAWIPKHERSRAWAFVGAGEAVGTIVALQVCPYLNHYLGWASIFWFSAAVGVAWLAVFVLLLADDPGSHRCISPAERDYIHLHRPPQLMAPLVESSSSASTSSSSSSSSPPPPPPPSSSGVAAVRRGRRCGEVPWCGFLRNPHFWGVMLTHVCYNWSSYFSLSWLPDFLNDRYRVTYEQLGFLSM
jgi:hypothetical protein